MRHHRLFVVFALGSASLFAQSEADIVAREVKDLPTSGAAVSRRAIPLTQNTPGQAPATVAPFQNVLAVLGDNYANNGVPCIDCVPGALGSTLGLPAPDTYLHADGTSSYVMVNYFVDQTYTGSCSWNFLVKDQAGKYIVNVPATFEVSAGESDFVATADTIPAYAAVAGNGTFEVLVTCGTTKTVSKMPIYIAYP